MMSSFTPLIFSDLDPVEAFLKNKPTLSVTVVLALMALIAGNVLPAAAQAQPAAPATGVDIPIPNIPYTKFVLSNGLTVLVHEDHKAPIVAVNTCITSARRTRSQARPGLPTCSNT